MNKLLTTLAILNIVLLGSIAYKMFASPSFGAATDCIDNTCLTSLYVTPGTLAVAGQTTLAGANMSGDLTVSGGSLYVPTTANATSSATVGCIQTYATSSATAIKMVFNTSATSTSINGGTVQGVVLWQYGTCPNL